MDTQRGDGRPQVVCTWCGGVISGPAAKAALRTCQPCFARMMREHSCAHQQAAGRRHASKQ